MSDWEAQGRDYATSLAGERFARAPATLGEIWDAEWKRNGLDTIGGIGAPLADSLRELQEGVEKEAGKTIGELAFEHNINIGRAATTDDRVRNLSALADMLPEDARKRIEPLKDVRRRASDKAQAIEREAADINAATYGLSGTATSFLAGIARQGVDAPNLALGVLTAPLGGAGGALVPYLARQAAAGAVATALTQPSVQAGRAELGLEAGVGQGVTNTLEGAAFAAGTAGVLRGFASLYRRAVARPDATVAPGDAPEAAPGFEPRAAEPPAPTAEPMLPLRDLAPEDFEAAAHVAERDAVVADATRGSFTVPATDARSFNFETGVPVNVEGYHGSSRQFDEHDVGAAGKNTGAGSAAEGIFYTSRYKTAKYYSEQAAEMSRATPQARQGSEKIKAQYERMAEEFDAAGNAEKATYWRDAAAAIDTEYSPNIRTGHIEFTNPLVVDFGGRVFRETSYLDVIRQAKAEGRDGVIIRNTFDAGEYNRFDATLRGRFRSENIYVAFDKSQVKSPDGRRLGRPVSAEQVEVAASAIERGAVPVELPPAPAPTPAATVGTIPPHNVVAGDGRAVRVEPVVVEARDLLTSSDAGYDAALQPRQRDRAASETQIREMASRLDPSRLAQSAEADRGAPIVGVDMMVESGNGRVLAIREAYRQGGEAARRYRAFLEQQGVDVAGFKEPVLVRRRLTELSPDERRAFTVSANQATTLAFSASERALADARMLTPDMLALLRNPGDLAAIANRDFARAFIGKLPQAEQGALIDATGQISAEGITRMRNAILGKAYGDAPVLARIAEAVSDDVKSLSNALVEVAPQWAQMKADIAAGQVRADMDLTAPLMEAVERTAHLRGKRVKLADFLAQMDAFEKPSAAVEDFMRMFYDARGQRAASAERVVAGLNFFVQEARKVGAEIGLDLGLAPVNSRDLQRLAIERSRGHEGTGSDLFAGGEARPGAGRETAGGDVRGSEAAGSREQPGARSEGGTAAARKANTGLKADAERALELAGGDAEIVLTDASGSVRKVSARDALRAADEDAAAAAELRKCVEGGQE